MKYPDPSNPSALMFRDLGDGHGIWLYPMLFTYRIAIGRIGSPAYTDGWCYRDLARAAHAFGEWNPATEKEPRGWVRHPTSGRRRFPDGDPATEEIRT